MPTNCRWYDKPEDMPNGPPRPGACHFQTNDWGSGFLSNRYHEITSHERLPIIVILPTRSGGYVPWCVDWSPTDDPNGFWIVTVDLDSLISMMKPDITVSPSINAEGLYHGFLEHGVLTDDLNA